MDPILTTISSIQLELTKMTASLLAINNGLKMLLLLCDKELAIKSIKQGLSDVDNGNLIPLDQVIDDIYYPDFICEYCNNMSSKCICGEEVYLDDTNCCPNCNSKTGCTCGKYDDDGV